MAFKLNWAIAAVVVVVVSVIGYFLNVSEEEIVLKGQRVIITGASSGIGEELAYSYSRLGASILITARRENLLTAVQKKCQSLGAKQVISVVGDMASAEDRGWMFWVAYTNFKGKLDVLILNHAVMENDVATSREIFEVNYISFVELASLTIDMLKAAGGRIGMISSIAGKSVQVGPSFSPSNFAIDGYFSVFSIWLRLNKANVSVTKCFLGQIATDFSGPDAFQSQYVNILPIQAVPVIQTADAILRAVHFRERELFYPFSVLVQYWEYRRFDISSQHFYVFRLELINLFEENVTTFWFFFTVGMVIFVIFCLIAWHKSVAERSFVTNQPNRFGRNVAEEGEEPYVNF